MNEAAYENYSKYNSDIYILSTALETIGYKIKFDQKNQKLSVFTPVIHRK